MYKIAKKEDFFNDETICIFTDASSQESIFSEGIRSPYTAPAYCIYHNNMCIEQGATILLNSTSQQGELYALLLGVQAAVKYKGFKIKIFGDNQNAIIGIRDWLYKWVIETNNFRSTLGQHGRIKNQDYYMDIIYTILSNQIPIELYHVKGHVDIKNVGSLNHAKELFVRSNPFIGDDLTDELAYFIAMGNTVVDNYSTTILKSYIENRDCATSGEFAVHFDYSKFNMNEYLSLVNRNGHYRQFNRPGNKENWRMDF